MSQDAFALRSHQAAFDAVQKGYLTEIVPVKVPGQNGLVTADNGIRVSTPEKLVSEGVRERIKLQVNQYYLSMT